MTDDLQNRGLPSEGPRDTGLGSDETRKADDMEPTGQDAPAGAPAGKPDWNAREWEGQNQPHARVPDAGTRATLEDAVTGEPKWNEHEVVGQGQGSPTEGPDDRVVPTEGDNEFSGHGHNPGGGERWADVDRGLPDDAADDAATRRERDR